jgi:hypothetical protein
MISMTKMAWVTRRTTKASIYLFPKERIRNSGVRSQKRKGFAEGAAGF